MPPRKSTSARTQATASAAELSQPQASSSKVKQDDIPLPDLPESLTPDYRAGQRARVPLSEEDRAAFVHEVGRTQPGMP